MRTWVCDSCGLPILSGRVFYVSVEATNVTCGNMCSEREFDLCERCYRIMTENLRVQAEDEGQDHERR